MDKSQIHCAEQKEQIDKYTLFVIQYIYDILEQTKLIPIVTVISGYPEVECEVGFPGSGPSSVGGSPSFGLFVFRWIYLNDQNLCIPASSSFVYGAVPIGASIYVIGDLDTGKNVTVILSELFPSGSEVCCLTIAYSHGLGTNYDYVREFKRSTGTWHHTKPLLPSDLRRTGCAALRIANCKLFRLQLQQGLFRIRVHSP